MGIMNGALDSAAVDMDRQGMGRGWAGDRGEDSRGRQGIVGDSHGQAGDRQGTVGDGQGQAVC